MLCIYWPISKMLLTLWGDAIMAPLPPLPSSIPQSAPVLGGSNISLGRAAEFALPFRLPPKNYFLVKTSKVPASSEQTPRECGRVVSSRGGCWGAHSGGVVALPQQWPGLGILSLSWGLGSFRICNDLVKSSRADSRRSEWPGKGWGWGGHWGKNKQF